MWLWAADWVGGSSVDAKLEAQDWVPGSVLVETIPTILYDRTNLGVDERVNIIADAKTRKELRHVAVGREDVDGGSGRDTIGRLPQERGSMARENKQIVVEFIGEGDWDVAGLWFRSPDLRGDVDD